MSFWKWFSTQFHAHEWEVQREMPITVYENGYVGNDDHIRASGVRYVLRCKVCGELRTKDFL